MRVTHGPTMGGAWVLTILLVTAACHSDPTPRSPGLARQLREVALTSERDSLLQEVAANGRLLGDIQAELARVQPRPAKGTPESPVLELTKDQRAYALGQVRRITTRLEAAETQVAASERRVRRLSQRADSLQSGLEEARQNVTDLVTIVGNQRATIDALTAHIEGLSTENLTLADSVLHLTDDHNTAYYVVGTRQELIAKGVLVPDGHRSIPLVGRRGVAPARELPLAEFTSIDRSSIHEIPLPHADRIYRIVSRQNLAHLASRAGNRGTVQGRIDIATPERFWEPSKYLIVVEQ
jgi:hypothetical protein